MNAQSEKSVHSRTHLNRSATFLVPAVLVHILFCCLVCRAVYAGSEGAGPDAVPDLDVTFIERTPKYPAGPWVYPATGPQYLGIGGHVFDEQDLKGKHKQWPAEGETVTFTAHIANKSNVPSKPCSFAWHLDGKKVASGRLPGIKPWEETRQVYRWKWRGGEHTIAFHVDPNDAVQEICEENNALEDRTDALSLQMRVTKELYEAWHTKPNGIGSYSFEDWCQRHVKIMNGVLAGSTYPKTAPAGILERVRIDDFVIMSKEEMRRKNPQPFGYDGGWNYYDDNFGKDNSWFDYHIKDNFTDRIDTGLIHELTHQIGIIDMYCIVIGAHWNHVLDSEGELLLMGYRTQYFGMMGGGGGRTLDFDGAVVPPQLFTPNADGTVTVSEKGRFAAYSEETAGALNALRGLRRGHYGLYLFDIPKHNFVRILDSQGKPVAGARVTVYQQNPYPGPQSIPSTPVYGGGTDSDGVFSLGSVPFGNINVVGLNGILFLVISARGHTEHHFLDVCMFNIAKWRGNDDEWTAVLPTGIPPQGAPDPPKNVWWGAIRPRVKPVLMWEPSPSKDVAAYNIYRQRTYLSVTFETPYEKIATVPASETSFEVELLPYGAGGGDTPWYTVTAVDEKGLESRYARNKELVRWGPVGNAIVERNEGTTVKITLPPGPSWIQARNSFVVRQNTKICLRIKTTSSREAMFRLSVAGLGNVDLPLDVLAPGDTDLFDGEWHEVDFGLRDFLDEIGKQKGVTTDRLRTTWNEDWLVMSCQFGDWSADSKDEAVFHVADFRLLEGR